MVKYVVLLIATMSVTVTELHEGITQRNRTATSEKYHY